MKQTTPADGSLAQRAQAQLNQLHVHLNTRGFMWKTVPFIILFFGVALLIFWSAFVGPSPTVVFDLRRDRFTLRSHDAWNAQPSVDRSLLSNANPCISPYAYACGNWTRAGDYLWDNVHHVFRRVALSAVAKLKWAPDAADASFSTTYGQCVREILSPPPDTKASRVELLSLLTLTEGDPFAAIAALGERALFPLLDWHIDNGTMRVHASMWTRAWPQSAIAGACRWLRSTAPTLADPSCEDIVGKKHTTLMQLPERTLSTPAALDLTLWRSITRGAFDDEMAAGNVTRLLVFSLSKIQWLAKMLERADPSWTLWLRIAILLDVSQYSTRLLRASSDESLATPHYALLTPDPLEDFRREYPPWVHGWGPNALTAGVAITSTDVDKARGAAEESCRWLMQELAPGVVGKYMRPDAKAVLLARRLFNDIKIVIRKDVDRANGLSAEWKAAVRARVDAMQLIIGFPYEGAPEIEPDAPLWHSALAWRQFHRQRDPLAKADWPGDYHPETVDATYSASSNAVYLPYALLHAPYLDVNAPIESHYARLGFMLAHEAMHGLTPEVLFAATGLHKDYMVQNSFLNCFTKNYVNFAKETKAAQTESLPDMMGARWAWSACLENKACAKKEAMRTFVQIFAQSFCSTRGNVEADAHEQPAVRVGMALSGAYDLAGRNLMQQAWGCDAAPQCSVFKR